MEKLKTLWREHSQSIANVKTQVAYFVGYALLFYVFGFWPSLIAVAVVAFSLPIYHKWRDHADYVLQRQLAITAIQNLYEKASMERSWHGLASDIQRQSSERFAVAQRRALKAQAMMALRSRHLDRCYREGITPMEGVGWEQLFQIADRTSKELESALYYCTQGLGGINPGLLDQYWAIEETIHTGDPELDEPEQPVVVHLSDYFRMRLKRTPLVPERGPFDCRLYDFAEEADAVREAKRS